MSKSLGLGEREAIVLARRLSLPLLVDDLRARKEAEKQGIKVIGSLGIIYVAKRRGLIRSAKEILDSFISSGYYISNTLYSTFLEEIGEKEQ
jgi:predicted nucleic acid-binding protein